MTSEPGPLHHHLDIVFPGLLGHLANPTLTTVRQPVEEMSQAIVEMVLDETQSGVRTSRTQLFRPTLEFGESSPEASRDDHAQLPGNG